MIENAFKESDLLSLADCIQKQLVSSAGVRVDSQCWQAEIRGFLNLSHGKFESDLNAHCRFVLSHDWNIRLPIVYCHERWLTREWDWHIGKNGYVCYELPLRWRDHVEKVRREQGIPLAAGFAAAWCLNSTRWLLFRHRFAYENRILIWPKAWPAWRHDEGGFAHYKRSALRRLVTKGA